MYFLPPTHPKLTGDVNHIIANILGDLSILYLVLSSQEGCMCGRIFYENP